MKAFFRIISFRERMEYGKFGLYLGDLCFPIVGEDTSKCFIAMQYA